MELKAAGFKLQRQNIQVSTGEASDAFSLSSSTSHAEVRDVKGQVRVFSGHQKPKSTVSGKHYAAFYSLEQSNAPDKAQITSLIYF